MMKWTYVLAGVAVLVAAGIVGNGLIQDSTAASQKAPEARPSNPDPVNLGVDGTAPSREHLLGTWTDFEETIFLRFHGRTVALAGSVLGLDSPLAFGEFRIDGTRLEFTGGCLKNKAWEAGLILGYSPEDDALDVYVKDEGCGVPSGALWELSRVDR